MSVRTATRMHVCELLRHRREKMPGKRDKSTAYALTKIKKNPAVEGESLKAALFYDMLRRDIQYTDLGGENKHIVVSDIVPCGTQSVSVKYGADGISV